ncbi:MAG: OprD family outer membrane porin [Campylobacter sp.]|nr:OprD family outer membrane porin [Campylobacter sp.]
MKLNKLSLAAVIALGCFSSANAADTLVEAFTNGKLSGTIKATYADVTDERSAVHNENIFGIGLELGYVTDPFYGFRLGITGQAHGSISPDDNAKTYYNKEWYANGAVLSELYLGYGIGKTDIKVGRQYFVSPTVAGNYTRAFKESFEGVSITNKDIPDTTLTAAWFYKFQGRSKVAMGSTDTGAPRFDDRVIVAGLSGPTTLKFDNIFTGTIVNKSIPGLTLSASYAMGTDVEYLNSKDDINIFNVEASYKVGVTDILKLGIDLNYKGSRSEGMVAQRNYEGDMFGVRLGAYDFYGFTATYAYTTMSDDDALIFSFGNGGSSYTALPIRGPFVFTGYAGMDTHKVTLGYDFGAIGVNGLKTTFQYINGEQDTPSHQAGATAANTHMDVEGWAAVASYAIPQVKGLTASATYVALERDNHYADGTSKKTDNDERWLQLSYKFNLLN